MSDPSSTLPNAPALTKEQEASMETVEPPPAYTPGPVAYVPGSAQPVVYVPGSDQPVNIVVSLLELIMKSNTPINVMPHYPPCGQCRGICRGILLKNRPRDWGLVISIFRESACKYACIHTMWSFRMNVEKHGTYLASSPGSPPPSPLFYMHGFYLREVYV